MAPHADVPRSGSPLGPVALSLAPVAFLGDGFSELLLTLALLLALLTLSRHVRVARVSAGPGTVLRLDEVAANLRRFSPMPVRSLVSPETPVALSPGSDPSDPWEIEVALLRAGLRIRPRAGRLEIIPTR